MRIYACASPVGAGMLEVLVVLKEMMVFIGGIFERVKSPNFFGGKTMNSKKKLFDPKKNIKNLRQSQKSTFTLESYIVFPFHCGVYYSQPSDWQSDTFKNTSRIPKE